MNGAAAAGRGPSRDDNRSEVTPYTRRTTDDRDEAEQLVSELYLPNRLDLSRGDGSLGMEVSGLRLGALTAGRLTYGRRVRLRTAEAQNFHVNIPLHGRAASRSGTGRPRASRPGEGLVFSPGAPADILWSPDCEQLCLMIPRTRLEAELEVLLGRPLGGRLVFDFTADQHSSLTPRLRTVMNLLVNELDEPTDLSGNVHVGRHVEGLVLDGLLLGARHSHSDIVAGQQPGAMSTAVKRAVDLLEEQPSQPWTTVRLATEVHLSVRALQEGFRRHLATPPMAYLRQVRLRRAREALQAAGRDTTTVRAVAVRLGIMHLGRFAAAYREAFGETPSETLNRSA
jgi:AraC-like DNA-binding protein